MEIKLAEVQDVPIIHGLMMKAFMVYKHDVPPSSALDETIDSIYEALMDQEKAFICYRGGIPVAMVRFRLDKSDLYFYRLSVLPEQQGQGIAKMLIHVLESYANARGISTLSCKVRLTVQRNIELYRSVGFKIVREELVYKPNGLKLPIVAMEKQLPIA